MEFTHNIDPRLLASPCADMGLQVSEVMENGCSADSATLDAGTQTEEPDSFYEASLLDNYPLLPSWQPEPPAINYYPHSHFMSPEFTSPYPEMTLMNPGSQYDYRPDPYFPMASGPVYPSFPLPNFPNSFEPAMLQSPSAEELAQDCIIASGDSSPLQKPRRSATSRKSVARKRRALKALSNNQTGRGRGPKPLLPSEQLSKPLSELAAELPDIPEVDMDSFVLRDVHQRLLKSGKIGRPLNAFILYRVAYISHARALTKKSKCQDLSRIIGASYRLESPEIKEKFSAYSVIEKQQHELHFPSYKYRPNQTGDYFNEDADQGEDDDGLHSDNSD
ncbi:hypothetical protein F4825DRAFT_231444 [Nemania diffusa]|nr:hypothetical protein F4825DRAFT_231444 [Nemania diffusa]